MTRILVIADDLSGAAEIAGIGARYGLPARIERDPPVRAHPGLTVLDTDTRLLPQDDAADTVSRFVRHLRGESFDLVYKKTDSALRGPIRAEIEALLTALNRAAGILVAQNPSRGRTIHDEKYQIDGVPLHQTSFAHDPEYPARTADALELLGRSSQRQTRCVTPPAALPADGISIGQAENAGEVAHWANLSANAPNVLPAGGADFFTALLEARGLSSNRPWLDALAPGNTLLACGTAPAFGGEIVKRASAENIPVCPMPDHLHGAATALDAWRAAAQAALSSTGRAVVVIQRPLDRSPGAPQRFQAAVAEVVARLLSGASAPQNLLLEGGATASAVCKRMQWRQLEVEGEFAAGVVQMRALHADGTGQQRIVVKPGSYPWPEAIWKSMAAKS